MEFLLNSPFTPIVAVCAGVALALALVALFTGSRLVAALAPVVVYLVAYYETYGKIPAFPPIGAANKVFYVAAFAALGALALGYVPRLPRAALALAASVFAALWIGWAKAASFDPAGLVASAAMALGGALVLGRIDSVAAKEAGGAPALAMLAALAALAAPIALFGGSSTGVGLYLGVVFGVGLLSLASLRRPAPLGAWGALGLGAGLVAPLDTLAIVTQKADGLALLLAALGPFLGAEAARRLPLSQRNKPIVVWLVSGLATLSPLPVIVALLFLRHDNPLGT